MAMESSPVAAAKKKGTSQGKQKIPIKKIEDRALPRVVFNKLRKDLFSMAAKLCSTTGARIDIIVFSPSGRLFTFGGPSVACDGRRSRRRCFAGRGRWRRCTGGWISYGRWLSQEPVTAREEAEAASKTTDVDPVTATPDDIPARD